VIQGIEFSISYSLYLTLINTEEKKYFGEITTNNLIGGYTSGIPANTYRTSAGIS
jgi:hypothetical protein